MLTRYLLEGCGMCLLGPLGDGDDLVCHEKRPSVTSFAKITTGTGEDPGGWGKRYQHKKTVRCGVKACTASTGNLRRVLR